MLLSVRLTHVLREIGIFQAISFLPKGAPRRFASATVPAVDSQIHDEDLNPAKCFDPEPPGKQHGARGPAACVGHTRNDQCPAASAPGVRVSAAPTRPSGVRTIELTEVNGGDTVTLCPRASSALTIDSGKRASTTVSSGIH